MAAMGCKWDANMTAMGADMAAMGSRHDNHGEQTWRPWEADVITMGSRANAKRSRQKAKRVSKRNQLITYQHKPMVDTVVPSI